MPSTTYRAYIPSPCKSCFSVLLFVMLGMEPRAMCARQQLCPHCPRPSLGLTVRPNKPLMTARKENKLNQTERAEVLNIGLSSVLVLFPQLT